MTHKRPTSDGEEEKPVGSESKSSLRRRRKSEGSGGGKPPVGSNNKAVPVGHVGQQSPVKPFELEPLHKPQESLFSTSSGYNNYRGFLNLCILLLVLSNARVAIENVLKYGILVDPFPWVSIFITEPYRWPMTSLSLCSAAFMLVGLFLERSLAAGRLSESIGFCLHAVNLSVMLILPVVVIILQKPNPLAASQCLSTYSVVFLKLISYAHVNRSYRRGRSGVGSETTGVPMVPEGKKSSLKHKAADVQADENNKVLVTTNGWTSHDIAVKQMEVPLDHSIPLVKYPDNLTLTNLAAFMMFPTLCYELNYPRTKRIRKWFLAKRLTEMIFLLGLILALSQQWIMPLLRNAVKPFVQMEYGNMLERLLKLAVPNHVIWLICFYWLFHSCLNVVAELTRFADREFYRDWWNAETITYFWSSWNMPVHRWCVRHLFKPAMQSGLNKFQASLLVFLVSAFFHEYLVSVPLLMFRWWAFVGMISQMPLGFLTAKVIRGKYGNMVVWLSLILGQPLCILMYLHDYYVLHVLLSPSASPSQNGTDAGESLPQLGGQHSFHSIF